MAATLIKKQGGFPKNIPYHIIGCSDDDSTFEDNDSVSSSPILQNARDPGFLHGANTKTRWTVLSIIVLALNLTALFLHALLIANTQRGLGSVSTTEYEPLRRIIKTDRQYWNLKLGDVSPYTNGTGPEVQEAWDEISAPPGKVGIFVVEGDELKRMGLSSTKLADGSGSIATINVFHQLHCLDLLRRWAFGVGDKGPSNPLWKEHLQHCTDSIRMSLQCNADVSLLTFKWIKNYSLPWPDFRSYHTCRNFDDILEWAREKRFDDKPGLWRHPELGDTVMTDNPMDLPGGVQYVDIDE